MDLRSFSKLIESVKCPICLDVLDNARELPCKHLLCAKCLNTHKGSKDVFVCPLCRCEIPKRKLLSRDKPLENLCICVRNLCHDFKQHYKSDILVYLESVNNEKKTEEPKLDAHKKPSGTPKKIGIKNNTSSKFVLPPQQKSIPENTRKGENELALIEPKNVMHTQDSKNKILNWLHNTKNRFGELTESPETQITQEDISLPSASQNIPLVNARNNIEMKNCKIEEAIPQKRRTRSSDNLVKNEMKTLKRRSLESSSSSKWKNKSMKNQEIIANKIIINLIEDEVLDAMDKEIATEKNSDKILKNASDSLNRLKSDKSPQSTTINDTTCVSNEKETPKASWKNINKLKKSLRPQKTPKKLDVSLQSTQKSRKSNLTDMKHNTSDDKHVTDEENKSVDFQKMEDYFALAIPKLIEHGELHDKSLDQIAANIGLNKQATSKDKKDVDLDKVASSCEDKETTNQERKTVDFQKMEDYFANVIPQLIEHGESHDKSFDHVAISVGQKIQSPQEDQLEVEKEDHESEGSGSEIYICGTQPSKGNEVSLKNNKIKTAIKLAKKLGNIITMEAKNESFINSIQPFIKRLHEYTQKTNENQDIQLVNNLRDLSEKEIQTDQLIFEKFIVDSFAALKSVNYTNTCNQTDFSVSPMKPRDHTSIGIQTDTISTISHQKTLQLGGENLKKIINDDLPVEVAQYETLELGKKALEMKNVSSIPTEMFTESCIPIENILEQCNTQVDANLEPTMKSTNYPAAGVVSSKTKCSQSSDIIYSIISPESKVNRKLLFEAALKNKNELEQTLKRVRTMNTNSDSDEERPNKVMCNRFVRNDLSIEFDSELGKSQSSENSDKLKEEKNPFKRIGTPQMNFPEECFTGKTALLDHCDAIIENANKQSQVMNKCPKNYEETMTKQQFGMTQNMIQNRAIEITTQEISKHCDELIEKVNKQIGFDKDVLQSNKQNVSFRYGNSQVASTSGMNVEKRDTRNSEFKTQDLLDHCNGLIEKTTKNLDREEVSSLQQKDEEKQMNLQMDDEFFSENIDQLDSVLEKAYGTKKDEKMSESLFETCIEHSRTHLSEQKTAQSRESFKASRFDNKNSSSKRIRVLQNVVCEGMKDKKNTSTSDEELFSDTEVVEMTPPRSKNPIFYDRLSCSQDFRQSSRVSKRTPEKEEEIQLTINFVPPPPGFGDADDEDMEEDTNQPKITQKESENIIPNSLSPERMCVIQKKKQVVSTNSKNVSPLQEVREMSSLSQHMNGISPICHEKNKNRSVIDKIQQSKFSPLTILPKAPAAPSPLTSTPKQKSILNYIGQNKPLSQPKREDIQFSQFCVPENRKPCVAYTRLNKEEVIHVVSLCNKKFITRRDTFGPDITHMIVSVDKNNRVKEHTMKYVSAIAAGIWVLNSNWVQECLKQNKIVYEEPFEAIDVSGIPSPRISRLSRKADPLFKGFKFHVAGPFAQTNTKEVENVIKLQSGIVVSSLEDLLDRENYVCIIIADSSTTEDIEKYSAWMDTYKVITVDLNWLTLSVSRYKLLSLKQFMQFSEDYSFEGLGYPSALLEDVPYTFTEEF